MKTHEDSSKKVLSALKNVGCSSSSIVVPRKRNKIWSEYSPQYQRKKRKQIANDVQVALSFMKDENFQHSKVELKNRETGEILSVGSDGSTTLERAQTPSDNLVEKTLYIKERFNVSNTVYHELAMVNNALPRSYALTKMVKELDSQSIIRPTPGTTVTGVQQSLTERLRKRIQCLAKSEPSFAPNQHIRVKITSDGTCISHSMHAVVIAFTIIAYEAHPNSPGGNHTIALLNTGEDYNHLSVGLEDICDEIRPLLLMKLNSVEFFFGADWKFLALCTGIEAANARYSCIWCKCPSEDRYDIRKTWSFKNIEEGARTIEEIQRLSKRGSEKFGCARQPLFPMIPIDHMIPDVLKGSRLILIGSKAAHVAKYEKFLNEQCKISFHM